MSGIFSKNVFPEYTSAKLMKPQMNGFNDPTLKDFSLLNTATLFQDDFKEEKFETEFIQSLFLCHSSAFPDEALHGAFNQTCY